MTDVNTPLIKAYFDAISALGYPVWEGEEPNDTLDKVYIVISDVVNNETSAKNASQTNSSIQVAINTWELGYNTSETVNTVAGLIFQAVHPVPQSTLLADSGIKIITTTVPTDITDRPVILAGRKYIRRTLIFSHYIYIQN